MLPYADPAAQARTVLRYSRELRPRSAMVVDEALGTVKRSGLLIRSFPLSCAVASLGTDRSARRLPAQTKTGSSVT